MTKPAFRKSKARTVRISAQIVSDLNELNWLGETFEGFAISCLRRYVIDHAKFLKRFKHLGDKE